MQKTLLRSNSLRRIVTGTLGACALTIGFVDAARAATGGALPRTLIAPVPHVAISDVGALASTTPIKVELVLNYRNADALEALIVATSDPGSPEYRQFLTPPQFEAAFAPAAADYARATATLVAAGFRISPSPTRSLIVASAPAAIVERFFATQLHAVHQPSATGVRYVNVTPASLPAALSDITFGVTGLNNLTTASSQIVRGPRRSDVALATGLQGPDTGLGPAAFVDAYELPDQYARPAGGTYDGSGQAAGIAIDSDLYDSDLAAFLGYFNVKRTAPVVRELIDGGPFFGPGQNADATEATLDTETIAGVAPGAAIRLYLMPQLSTSEIVATYSQVVADDKVAVLNSSFGGCEYNDNLSTLSDHIAQQGAAEGITFSAASGDSGSLQCAGYYNPLGVSAPASAPHFTAVGGTSLVVSQTGTYLAEAAWSGSGGGVSILFKQPTYQAGIAHMIGGARNVPDIAFDANPGSGAALYQSGYWSGPIGGTSLSSPIFCAYVTELNEFAGKRSGQINTSLYAQFKATAYQTHFRDIKIGNNIVKPGYPGYFAGPGYDDVTGIGSLIGTPNAK